VKSPPSRKGRGKGAAPGEVMGRAICFRKENLRTQSAQRTAAEDAEAATGESRSFASLKDDKLFCRFRLRSGIFKTRV